jgi:transcription initiation factor TFIIIB Brf1 subunit/transcription initiation factor TFIIB
MDQIEQPDETVFWDEPCPRCRSSLRYVKRSEPGKVFCDGCGYVEGEEPH